MSIEHHDVAKGQDADLSVKEPALEQRRQKLDEAKNAMGIGTLTDEELVQFHRVILFKCTGPDAKVLRDDFSDPTWNPWFPKITHLLGSDGNVPSELHQQISDLAHEASALNREYSWLENPPQPEQYYRPIHNNESELLRQYLAVLNAEGT